MLEAAVAPMLVPTMNNYIHDFNYKYFVFTKCECLFLHRYYATGSTNTRLTCFISSNISTFQVLLQANQKVIGIFRVCLLTLALVMC